MPITSHRRKKVLCVFIITSLFWADLNLQVMQVELVLCGSEDCMWPCCAGEVLYHWASFTTFLLSCLGWPWNCSVALASLELWSSCLTAHGARITAWITRFSRSILKNSCQCWYLSPGPQAWWGNTVTQLCPSLLFSLWDSICWSHKC